MVWRKVILSFLLICCILLVAASGSPANAADEDTTYYEVVIPTHVPLEIVQYVNSYLCNSPLNLGQDYLLFCLDNPQNDEFHYLCLIGEIDFDGEYYVCDPEKTLLVLDIFGSYFFNALDGSPFGSPFKVSNPEGYIVYSNVGNNLSLYERSDIYAYASLVLIACALVCYLLRSVFNFCLRRND